MISNRRKAVFALAGMATAAAGALAARPTRTFAAMGADLNLDAEVPQQFGAWQVDAGLMPLQPNPQLQRALDEAYDQILARTYRNQAGYRVMLSMAYGGRRDQSMDIHRPEVCYPAQGLSVRRDTFDASLSLPERALPMKRLVAGSGERNEPITYWLVIGDGVTTYGYGHRLTTLKYGLTGRVPDGMLIRTSSIDKDEARSFAMQDAFLNAFFSALRPQFRRRLIGAT